jgi:small subunit ribosomal protein S7
MGRRKGAESREVVPDPRYGSELVTKFINSMMKEGKKSLAQRIFYNALAIVEEKTKKKGLSVFEEAVENVKPIMKVRSRRVGGATYQVPTKVRASMQIGLAVRWIIQATRGKAGRPMSHRLAEELILASKKEGTAYKKREDTHRMAEANKAFAHFRW